MKYYEIVQSINNGSDANWDITETILSLGGIHYTTHCGITLTIRRFVIFLDDLELTHLKLKIGQDVTIAPANSELLGRLSVTGYLGREYVQNSNGGISFINYPCRNTDNGR